MPKKAPESSTIQRARKKLKKQMTKENEKITPEALKQVAKNISRWITRHSPERVDLKTKRLTLFDENKHSVPPASRFVTHLKKEIDEELQKSKKNLRGRIKG